MTEGVKIIYDAGVGAVKATLVNYNESLEPIAVYEMGEDETLGEFRARVDSALTEYVETVSNPTAPGAEEAEEEPKKRKFF